MSEPLSDLPDSGYVFRTGWKLFTSDIDDQRRVRLDGIARYIQEVGAEHLVDAEYAEIHPHWIVQRTVIDVIEPLDWPNDITFRRWCSGISSRWCSMRVRLDGSTGGRIETEGFWINMNKDTLTPSRMAEGFFNRLATTTENHRLKWRPWLTRPLEAAATATPFALRHTDGDHFEHVNNTVYWQGVHEVLAHAPDLAQLSEPPYRAVVEYRKPIKLDESITIRSECRNNLVHIWFCVGEDVRATALICKL
ncbi:acyl-[acyl-carrier-protein] thioesterase [Mycobacterium sp.]|uniref:acyl-[acyl-carrier-protein] thioesterase n=1 Tax=Mycobacterium sp. TaxID=1785 RepID=UPI003F9C61B0